jgi:hypothetical protein
MAKDVAILTKTSVTVPRHSPELDHFGPALDRFARVIDHDADHRRPPLIQYSTLAPVAIELQPGVHRS